MAHGPGADRATGSDGAGARDPDEGGDRIARTTTVLVAVLVAAVPVVAVLGVPAAGTTATTPATETRTAPSAAATATADPASSVAVGAAPNDSSTSTGAVSATVETAAPSFLAGAEVCTDVRTTFRNGSVVSVNVTTRRSPDGPLADGTVTVQVPDDDASADPAHNFTGEWLPSLTLSGTVESVDRSRDLVTLSTGSDGYARLFLRTDRRAVDLRPDATTDFEAYDPAGDSFVPVNDTLPGRPVDTGVFVHATDDPSVSDTTGYRFLGVKELQAASINGVVTNATNRPLPRALVVVDRLQFRTDGSVLDVEPVPGSYVDGQPTRFRLTYRKTGTSRVLTDDQLIEGVDFERFPGLNDSTGDSFVLATRTRPASSDDPGIYTLGRVPVLAGSTATPSDNDVDYRLTAYQRVVDGGAGDARVGNGSATTTAPGVSAEGNVVVRGARAPRFVVTDVSTSSDPVAPGDSFTVRVTVRNEGSITGQTDVDVSLEGVGVVGTATTETLSVGESGTVSVLVSGEDTDGLSGTRTVAADTGDDVGTASVTFESGGSSSAVASGSASGPVTDASTSTSGSGSDGATTGDAATASADREARAGAVSTTLRRVETASDVGRVEAFGGCSIRTVPRDRVVFAVNVTTREFAGGPVTNATVTVQVPDEDNTTAARYNLSGEWLPGRTESGRVRAVNDTTDHITLDTGPDGNATLYLRTDREAVDLRGDPSTPFKAYDPVHGTYFRVNDTAPRIPGPQTGVFTFLTFDLSVTDGTPYRFVGVKQLDSAPINGVVTNSTNVPVPRVLVVPETIRFRSDGERLLVDPVPGSFADGQPTQFRVVDTDTGTSRLYDVEELVDGIRLDTFPGLNHSEDVRYTLAARTRPVGSDNEGIYTLGSVPARPGSSLAPSNNDVVYRLTAYQRIVGVTELGEVSTGAGTATVTGSGISAEGNVVVPGASAPNFTVVDVRPTADPVAPGDPATVAVTVRNDGGIAARADVTLSVDGTPVDAVRTGVLSVGEREVVSATVPGNRTADRPGETLTVTAATRDDAGTATVNVTETTAPEGVDVDGDGRPSTDPDGDGVHEDVNGDGEFTTADVQALLDDLVGDGDALGRDLFDVDGGGDVGTGDVQRLLNELVGAT